MPASDPTTSSVRYVEIKPGYRAGDDGSVWSCMQPGRHGRPNPYHWRRLKPTPQHRGHMTVFLGRGDQRFVHRLILEAFVGLCPEGMECRHLDGNPGNNRLGNIIWGSRKENHGDSVRHGTNFYKPGADHPSRVIGAEEVRLIVQLCREGMTQASVAALYGIHETNVNAIMTGRSWSSLTGLVYETKRKGRKGEVRQKLSDEDVERIKALRARGLTYAEIGKQFGVSGAMASMIARGLRRQDSSDVTTGINGING